MATKPPIINEGDKPNRNACLHQWSYDLRLGKEAYLSSQKYLQHLDSDRDSIVIEPGEFALLMTYESVNIPRDCVAFISLRFSYALKGLINISGFHVDPGYEGKLVFSVYNAGPNPVVMRYLDPVFMIVFASLDKPALSRGKEVSFKEITQLKADWISAVKGPAVSLTRLNSKVERLSQLVNVLIGLVGSLVATVVIALVLGVRP